MAPATLEHTRPSKPRHPTTTPAVSTESGKTHEEPPAKSKAPREARKGRSPGRSPKHHSRRISTPTHKPLHERGRAEGPGRSPERAPWGGRSEERRVGE